MSEAVLAIIDAVKKLSDEDRIIFFAAIGQGEAGDAATAAQAVIDQRVEKLRQLRNEQAGLLAQTEAELKKYGVKLGAV
jgi:hypothetical protein